MPIELPESAITEKNKLNNSNTFFLLIEINYKSEDTVRLCLNNEEITWLGETWYPAIFTLEGLAETKDGEIPKVTLNFYDLDNIFIPTIDEYDGCSGAEIIIRSVNSAYLATGIPDLEEHMSIISATINDKSLVALSLGAEDLSSLRIPKQRYLKNNCRFKFKVATVSFSGGNTLSPVSGDQLYGLTSNAWAKILSVDFSGGEWDDSDASGTFTILHVSGGAFEVSGEWVNCYSSTGTLLTTGVAYFTDQPIGRCNYTGAETSCDRSFPRCQELENATRFGGFPGIGTRGLLE